MNIYVGNLPYTATEDDIREIFAAHGEVATVNIIMDKFSGQSKGFGFVEMPDQAAAEAAIELGEQLQFWGHDSWDEDGDLVNYTWDFDDGNFAWIDDPLHTFEDYGTFDVTLTVRDDDGLEAVATLTIYVNAPPVPVIDAQPLELMVMLSWSTP